MTINNKPITFSIILFRTEEEGEYNNKFYYTSDTFFLWEKCSNRVKEILLPGLKGSHMIDLSNTERENLWLELFKKELVKIRNLPLELIEFELNIYLNCIIYKKTGGRYSKEYLISLENLKSWSEIEKAELDYNETEIENFHCSCGSNGYKFWTFYDELLASPSPSSSYF